MIESLHIGGDLVINGADIIGIFSGCADNADFIEIHKSKFRLKNISEKNRSFILTRKKKETLIYYSKTSAEKLIKRLDKANSGGS